MHATFLLGPAGSGKTHRCRAEIRAELLRSPEGLPLILLAPKQATFQLERQLLSDASLPGYTRLHILSFERLAGFVFDQLERPVPKLLAEEGRVMVLRALLEQKRDELELFRASARLTGFARQLSLLLREFQRYHLTPARLQSLAARVGQGNRLDAKLRDVALILRGYLDWLDEHRLQDADCLLDLAAEALRSPLTRRGETVVDSESSVAKTTDPGPRTRDQIALRLGGLWLDGFAQMTPQELDFLATLMPSCERATLAFCLEDEPKEDVSWLSTWSVVGQTFRNCCRRLASLPECPVKVMVLGREPGRGRFADSDVLAHLEKHWANPKPFEAKSVAEFQLDSTKPLLNRHSPEPSRERNRPMSSGQRSPPAEGPGGSSPAADSVSGSLAQLELEFERVRPDDDRCPPRLEDSIRVAICPNAEAEAALAAREILRHVRADGRYRDCAVLLRRLEGYHDVVRRVFNGYEIPFFLDRREPVAHHPLAELTRYALRTVAFGWERDDWFGALKTGLVHDDDAAIDRLENEALARGWRGETWLAQIKIPAAPELEKWVERLRQQIVPPFQKFSRALAALHHRPSGAQLSAVLGALWKNLEVNRQLEEWNTAPATLPTTHSRIHETVWEQMMEWLRNLELAFPTDALSLGDWLPVVEAGLGNLNVGVVPPALDQVLVGTIDRSRNPELELALVLGVNEGVLPAPPSPPTLLSKNDRETLAAHDAALGLDHRQQIGLERYYGYVACTRARKRLVLTCAERDLHDRTLDPSPFIHDLQGLFPGLEPEEVPGQTDWTEAEHWSELVVPYLKSGNQTDSAVGHLNVLLEVTPSLRSAAEKWQQVAAAATPKLSPAAAERLYGNELRTSVSGLEDFAACPFKFFAGRGLRAEERVEFEVDPREKGSFQHQVLKEFHRRVKAANKNWRDLSPAEARVLVREIGEAMLPVFRDGLFLADHSRRFTARMLIESLEKLAEALIGWTRQYAFDPIAVEVGFGLRESRLPAWRIDLDGRHALVLRGRIDRVDVCRIEDTGEALAVVIDYKSSVRELDPVLLHHGLELQLLGYLGVLSHAGDLESEFGVAQLRPAGVFYVGLKGGVRSALTRDAERDTRDKARIAAYQHRGRFNGGHLERFDNRGAVKGDQFRYSRNSNGGFSRRGNEALSPDEFHNLLAQIEQFLQRYGREIYAGKVEVAPYRWKDETACGICAYRPICRFDPWVQPYRVLHPPPKHEDGAPVEGRPAPGPNA